METTARFASDAYSLIAGPPSLRGYSLDTEPPSPASLDSQDVHAFAEYPVDEVLTAILALPGMRLLSEPGRRGACWASAWEDGDRLILLEDSAEWDGLFGELKLRCDCRVTDVLELWESLRGRYPGLWLIGPDSRLLSPGALFLGYREFDTNWRTSDVLALARGIRADGAFDRLPILADALQDANCNDPDILNHCRGHGPHAPGCWVVDVALGSTDHNRPIRITSWEDFYRRLLVDPMYGEPVPKPTQSQLDNFEAETGFLLPQSYREYVVVFGPGKLLTDWDIAAPGYQKGWFWNLRTMDENMRPAERWVDRHPDEHRDRVRRWVYFCSKYKDAYGWDPVEVTDFDAHEYAVYRLIEDGRVERVAESFREFVEGAMHEILTHPSWNEGNPDLGPRLRFEPATKPVV